jgi:hypothetical protein
LGASHNVFVGKVLGQSGDTKRYNWPETQFLVQVVYNVKGNVKGTVTVDQEGGYINGVQYIAEDSQLLLRPGVTYLLSTRYSDKYNWYTAISHPAASKIISENQTLTTDQLKTLATNDEKVRALESAYPNEILDKSDVAANRKWNSYESRHYDANGQLIDDTVALHAEYMAAHPDGSTEPAASAAPTDAPVASPTPSDAANSPDASVAPYDASTGDMASPMPSDMPLAS